MENNIESLRNYIKTKTLKNRDEQMKTLKNRDEQMKDLEKYDTNIIISWFIDTMKYIIVRMMIFLLVSI